MLFGKSNYRQGDILVADRGLVKHYGVYVGNNEVVHFCSDSHGEILNPADAIVKQTTLRRFASGDEVYVDNLSEENRLDSLLIVTNAKSFIGSNLGGFSLMNNNSKHFARMCETGKNNQNNENAVVDKLSNIKDAILSIFK